MVPIAEKEKIIDVVRRKIDDKIEQILKNNRDLVKQLRCRAKDTVFDEEIRTLLNERKECSQQLDDLHARLTAAEKKLTHILYISTYQIDSVYEKELNHIVDSLFAETDSGKEIAALNELANDLETKIWLSDAPEELLRLCKLDFLDNGEAK